MLWMSLDLLMTEALTLGVKSGVELDRLLEAIERVQLGLGHNHCRFVPMYHHSSTSKQMG